MLREAGTEDRKIRRKRKSPGIAQGEGGGGRGARGEDPRLAQRYDVRPNRIQDWRSRLVGNAERLFERGAGRDNDSEHQVRELHAKIGNRLQPALTMERDCLSGKLGR